MKAAKRLTVWLDAEPYDKLKNHAGEECRSVSSQARLLLLGAITQSGLAAPKRKRATKAQV